MPSHYKYELCKKTLLIASKCFLLRYKPSRSGPCWPQQLVSLCITQGPYWKTQAFFDNPQQVLSPDETDLCLHRSAVKFKNIVFVLAWIIHAAFHTPKAQVTAFWTLQDRKYWVRLITSNRRVVMQPHISIYSMYRLEKGTTVFPHIVWQDLGTQNSQWPFCMHHANWFCSYKYFILH